MSQNRLGDGAEQKFAQARTSMSANNDQIHLVSFDDVCETLPNLSMPNVIAMRYAVNAFRNLVEFFFGFGVSVFV